MALINRDWNKAIKKYERFLCGIDLSKYAHFREIKTVEQDLPKELIPLEVFYRFYWDRMDYKSFDEIFSIYWNEKLNPFIVDFIKKYFYGCSLIFVEEGLMARLYRTWMSVLTQFHFQYLWNATIPDKLESTSELDRLGIDARVEIKDRTIGIQIEKISYRREVSSRKFGKRQQKYVDLMVEIPYVIDDPEELRRKIESNRTKDSTKKKCQKQLKLFQKYFERCPNGFVVFKETYVKLAFTQILKKSKKVKEGKITYDELLPW